MPFCIRPTIGSFRLLGACYASSYNGTSGDIRCPGPEGAFWLPALLSEQADGPRIFSERCHKSWGSGVMSACENMTKVPWWSSERG